MSELVIVLLGGVLLGHLLDRALLGDPAVGWIERLGRGLMLGLGLLGLVPMLLDTTLAVLVPSVERRVTPATVLSALGLLAAVLAVVAWRRAPRAGMPGGAPRPSLPPRQRLVQAGLLLIALAGLALPVWSGWVRPTFQFDALVRWMFKAKAIHYDGTLLGALSTDPAFALTHQRYPPLVSHVAAMVAHVGRLVDPNRFGPGAFDDRLTSAIFPWFAVALVAVVHGSLARRVGRLTAALAAAWIAHLPLLAYQIAYPPGAGAFSAMADIPLALFLTGAVLAAWDAQRGRPGALLEAGLLLGLATLTKNEGMPAVLGLGLGLALAGGAGRWKRALGAPALGLALFLLAWGSAIVLLGLPATDEDYHGQVGKGLEPILAGLDRLGRILPRLGLELVDFRSWNLTWPAVLVLLVAGGRAAWRLPGARLFLTVVAVQLAAYVYAYVITSWSSPGADMVVGEDDPVGFLMQLTLGRLLVHVAPVAICAALLVAPLESAPRAPAAPEQPSPRSG